MPEFYRDVVASLQRTGALTTGMEVLVLCGGPLDKSVLEERGFTDVTISNVDPRANADDFAPYRWSYQDAEEITLPDDAVDFCIVHSGLHHCQSPHKALLEMYRVARKGLLLFEPYDNMVTRAGVRLGIGQDYEHASVFCNDGHFGGVRNTDVPNFIYRWTEQEIVKTINTYAPHARHDMRFFHKMRIPWTQLRKRRNKAYYYLVRLGQPALKAVELAFPKQSNNFAAAVLKPELPADLHPWLRQDGGQIRMDERWLADRYRD